MRQLIGILTALFLVISGVCAQTLKPYTIAMRTTGNVDETENMVVDKLRSNGFEILGTYTPASDDMRRVVIVGKQELFEAVKLNGGLTGFASGMRVAVTREGGEVIVSYTTPEYWANAYFRDDYPKVEKYIMNVAKAFQKTFSNDVADQFGSEKGITPEKLREYKYMMGMPRFDDTQLLGEFASYAEAVRRVEVGLANNNLDLTEVYSIEIPSKKLKLYGVQITGEDGEASFMPVIDISSPKHTAFLPYELLVVDNEVHMLHGRFRIALSFPDLTMGTFMKIVSTPKDINRLYEALVNEPLTVN